MSTYKATIILACYNKENCIGDALQSLVELSRFPEFEVIVVDDRSRDGSTDIVRRFQDEFPNIRLIELPVGSGGPSRPRNTGIRESTTDYLIFMDPDDKVINDGYSILLTKMEEYRSDILIGTRVGVDAYGRRVFVDFIDERFTYVNQKDDRIVLDLLNRRPFILKTIYSKRLLQENGIAFNEGICTSEDEAFDMKCVGYASRITKINDIVYQYTAEADGSITTSVSPRMYKDLYDVMVELIVSYRLSFSDPVIAERLVALIDVFYIRKMAFLASPSDVEEACKCIYDAFDRYGYGLFSSLVSRARIDLLSAIREHRLEPYVLQSMLQRIHTLNADKRRLGRELNKQRRKVRRQRKLLNRRVVKPAVALARILSKEPSSPTREGGHSGNAAISNNRECRLISFSQESMSLVESNGFWLFMDRPSQAKDNAESLYRYVACQKIHSKIAFILDKDSIDYARLAQEGFNLLEFDSEEHWRLLRNADILFTSHCDEYVLHPWYFDGLQKMANAATSYPVRESYKLVFLQHGVIRSDLSSWLGTKDFYKIIASSPIEKESLLSIPQYRLVENQIVLSGLARWDNLTNTPNKTITIFPTWRKELRFDANDYDEGSLMAHPFFQSWISFCRTSFLRNLGKRYTINFVTHHDNEVFADVFERSFGSRISVVRYSEIKSFSEIVNTSSVLITDYSSFSFDFLYLRKPVIYFDFEENALANNYKGMEYDNFGYYCKTVEEAEAALKALAANDFCLDDVRLANIDTLLPPCAKNHCKRIVDAITNP